MQRTIQPTSYVLQAVVLLSLSCMTTAQVLTFGPGALPPCAYGCTPLYSAQYDCPSETVPGNCFCQTGYIKPSIEGGSICSDVCPPGAGEEEVNAWIRTVCKSFVKDPSRPDNGEGNSGETGEGEPGRNGEEENDDKVDEGKPPSVKAARAIAWWKKNWQWFLMAFLLVALPIALYAMFFPVRKWWKRRRSERLSRKFLTVNVSTPTAPHPSDPMIPYTSGGLNSPGLEAQMMGQGWQRGRWDNSSARGGYVPAVRRQAGIGWFPEMQQVSSTQQVPRQDIQPGSIHSSQPYGAALPGPMMGLDITPQQQSTSTGFQTGSNSHLAGPPVMSGGLGAGSSVRQHTWERQMRAEYERGSVFSRLAFWR